VRHPNVLVFLHSTEAEMVEGSVVKPTIYLVTEPVMPLADKIKELDLQGTQRYLPLTCSFAGGDHHDTDLCNQFVPMTLLAF
jgi:hypothetical protein